MSFVSATKKLTFLTNFTEKSRLGINLQIVANQGSAFTKLLFF